MAGVKYKALDDAGDTLRERYFKTVARKIEFALCVILYITFAALQISQHTPDNAKGFITQIQSFVAIYFTIRFCYFGCCTILAINLYEWYRMILAYFATHNSNLLLGLSLKLFTVVSVLIVARLIRQQELQKNQLHTIAIRDELTNAYNRRYFYMRLSREITAPRRDNKAVGLVMMDIDNFKMLNDVYGHTYGDDVIKITSELATKALKGKGTLYRYGGDEFALLLPDVPLSKLEDAVIKFKNEFEELRDAHYLDKLKSSLSLSIGISQYPGLSGSAEELVSQADIAMYHAKNLGKDKVCMYQDFLMEFRQSISSDNQQFISVFKTLLSTVSAKDKYTLGHSQRVSSYAVNTGCQLGLSRKDITILQYAGLLHDIGKIVVPEHILNKAERLTDEEFGIIRKHPIYSANILEPLERMDKLIDYVRHHHERFDGKGYPDGLRGNEISLGARILCVADSFDAMLSDRPYSKSLSMEQAFLELKRCSGTQFDPEVAEAFMQTFENKQEDVPAGETLIAADQAAAASPCWASSPLK